MSNQEKNQHLMWRAGFGPAVEQLTDLSRITPQQLFTALKKSSAKKPEFIDVADDFLKGLFAGIEEAGRQQRRNEMSEDERKKVQQKQREGVRSLNLNWLKLFVNTDAQLREKTAFFWHGHFACRNLNVFFQQGLLDVLRRNALGSFRIMLHEVSKTAAMLNFLNNQQNKKDQPNENFAREVMELFTMGRGHYSENDIREAARAFTGWSAGFNGEFIFRRFQHDFGSKTVLGKTGNFDGAEVLDILLEHKQTAKYVTQKLYRFFVNDNPDNEKIDWLADRFYKSDYDIGKLMDDIFNSNWFYEAKNIGSKIKSPIELIAGIRRMLPMKLENEEAFTFLQRALGQVLFYPPNVAGWPGGKTWIDSSSLMLRMRIPQLLNETDELNLTNKDDDDQMMGRKTTDTENKMMGYGKRSVIKATIEWKDYLNHFAFMKSSKEFSGTKIEKVQKDQLVNEISKSLLQTSNPVNNKLIQQHADDSNMEKFIRSATLQLMSTPEYQLC
ncbi:MAG TPA: DUF1800 domain-containing protein [Chitinophagaceae bacterium]|nr:DUF1800 domain-containing protein [Chitinophagaceae bacterium]